MHLDKYRIFIAEDDLSLASALEDMLRFMNFIVVGPYHTLDSAFTGSDIEEFDAALLDVNLGGEKVFLLAAKLEREGVPFLFMSGLKDSLPPNLAKLYRCIDKGTLVQDLEAEVYNLLSKYSV